MREKYRLYAVTPTAGDETTGYEAQLYQNMTLNEFLADIQQHHADEHGTIKIWTKKSEVDPAAMVSFSGGEIMGEERLAGYRSKSIKKITARGGWGLMNYNVMIKEAENDNPTPKKQQRSIGGYIVAPDCMTEADRADLYNGLICDVLRKMGVLLESNEEACAGTVHERHWKIDVNRIIEIAGGNENDA